MTYKVDKIERVKTLVNQTGGWINLLSRYHCFGPAIEKAYRGCQSQVPCPFGGQGVTKFRFIISNNEWDLTGAAYHEDHGRLDGISLVAMAERVDIAQALNIIAEMCGGLDKVTDGMLRQHHTQVSEMKELTPDEVAKRNHWLSIVAEACTPASQSDVVAKYLKHRGLKGDMSLLPQCLFFNPALLHVNDEKQKSFWPGLVASVTDENYDVVSLHRHYITREGKKAPVDKVKKMMSPNRRTINGCSIKLDAPIFIDGQGLIGVCEGLETALAVREATGMPMWAGIDAGKMRSMDIPKEITTVVIWGDHDRSKTGDIKSEELKARLEQEVPGRNVIIHIPNQINIPHKHKSVDWLDVYNVLGAEYFPMFIRDENYAVNTGVMVPVQNKEEAA